MEGKKINASILPLAIDLREVERWGSKEQEGLKKTLGWAGIPSFSQEVARRGRGKKTPPYIDNGKGSHNLKVQSS